MPLFVGEDPELVLREIVDILNRGSEANERFDDKVHARLLRLVRAWKKSGPDLFKMQVVLEDNAQMHEMEKGWEWHLAPSHSGGACWASSPTGSNFRDFAAIQFVRLITNPEWDRLGGPCPKCDFWYVKKTRRQSTYCSRKCAGNATKTKQRRLQHSRDLDRVQKAIKNYRTRPARFKNLDWMEYVCRAEDGITKNWLTMEVNKGELRSPKG